MSTPASPEPPVKPVPAWAVAACQELIDHLRPLLKCGEPIVSGWAAIIARHAPTVPPAAGVGEPDLRGLKLMLSQMVSHGYHEWANVTEAAIAALKSAPPAVATQETDSGNDMTARESKDSARLDWLEGEINRVPTVVSLWRNDTQPPQPFRAAIDLAAGRALSSRAPELPPTREAADDNLRNAVARYSASLYDARCEIARLEKALESAEASAHMWNKAWAGSQEELTKEIRHSDELKSVSAVPSAQDNYHFDILQKCHHLLCNYEESHSLLPEKIQQLLDLLAEVKAHHAEGLEHVKNLEKELAQKAAVPSAERRRLLTQTLDIIHTEYANDVTGDWSYALQLTEEETLELFDEIEKRILPIVSPEPSVERRELAGLVEVLKLVDLHFQRCVASDSWMGDDEHEAWAKVRSALKTAAPAVQEQEAVSSSARNKMLNVLLDASIESWPNNKTLDALTEIFEKSAVTGNGEDARLEIALLKTLLASEAQAKRERADMWMEKAEMLDWLHAGSEKDAEGFEWGVYRVKWENGKAVQVWQTLSDLSDLRAAMEAGKS